LLWVIFKANTKIFPGRIVYHNGFSTREILSADIEGYRAANGYVWITSRVQGAKRIQLFDGVLTDPRTASWFQGLVDLDARDRKEAESQYEADEAHGPTVSERRAKLLRLRKVARALTALTWAVGAWAWLWPQPYRWAVGASAALLPAALAIALLWRNQFAGAIDEDKKDARPSLSTPIVISAIVLMLRAILDVSLLDKLTALVATVIIAVCLTALFLLADRRLFNKKLQAISLFLVCIAYGYGAYAQADVMLDAAAPQSYPTVIVSKYKSSGKTTTYEVRVTPVGPENAIDEVYVGRSFYETLRKGDRICIYVGRGRLGARWYEASRC
jgi:hypothetical protein